MWNVIHLRHERSHMLRTFPKSRRTLTVNFHSRLFIHSKTSRNLFKASAKKRKKKSYSQNDTNRCCNKRPSWQFLSSNCQSALESQIGACSACFNSLQNVALTDPVLKQIVRLPCFADSFFQHNNLLKSTEMSYYKLTPFSASNDGPPSRNLPHAACVFRPALIANSKIGGLGEVQQRLKFQFIHTEETTAPWIINEPYKHKKPYPCPQHRPSRYRSDLQHPSAPTIDTYSYSLATSLKSAAYDHTYGSGQRKHLD